MTDLALLNPQADGEAAGQMLIVAKGRLERLERELTTTVLDRDKYLLKIGAAQELRLIVNDLQVTYDRHFRV